MDINSISGSTALPQQTQQQPPAAAQNNEAAQNANINDDTYEPSNVSKNNYKPDMNKLKQMMAEGQQMVDSFRKMFEGMINKQAGQFEAAFGASAYDMTRDLGAKMEMLEVDEATRAAAQADIADGGYWSVESTATRILDFAVALSGGDPSKISLLREAVQEGYDKATQEWGKELPSMSKQTLEAVMNGFDEWEKSGSVDGITLLQNK